MYPPGTKWPQFTPQWRDNNFRSGPSALYVVDPPQAWGHHDRFYSNRYQRFFWPHQVMNTYWHLFGSHLYTCSTWNTKTMNAALNRALGVYRASLDDGMLWGNWTPQETAYYIATSMLYRWKPDQFPRMKQIFDCHVGAASCV